MKKIKSKFDLKEYMKDDKAVVFSELCTELINSNYITCSKGDEDQREDDARSKVLSWIKSDILIIDDYDNLKYNTKNIWTKYRSIEDAENLARGWHFHKDNPYKEIKISVKKYWENEETILEFMSQFLAGYIWACKHDMNFMAKHEELKGVEQLFSSIVAYKAMQKKKDPEALYGQNFVPWCVVQLGVLLPQLWD